MLHITGYGRGGPKSDRPGYGTLAEAMSGFAHVTGQPDGPPTLPPFMLADGVASLAATYAVMMALYHRDVHGGGGQLVDVNLIEPLARLIESSTLSFDQLGVVAGPGRQPPRRQRAPQRLPHRRRQVAGHLQRVAEHRHARVPGHRPARPGRGPRLRRPGPPPGAGRRGRRAGRRLGAPSGTLDEAMAVFEAAEVTAAPVYDAEQLLRRRAPAGRGAPSCRVDDPDFGPVTVQAPVAAAHRDARPGRAPRPRARRRQRRGVRRAARASTPSASPRCERRRHRSEGPCANPEPGDPSWPRRPAARRCARRRRRRAPTSCSSTSRTPAPRRPRRGPGRSRSPPSPARTGAARSGPCGSTASTRPGATATSSRSSPAPARPSTCSSCPRPARPATCGGSTCCSPSWRPSSACSGASASRCSSRSPRAWPTRSRSPGPATGSRRIIFGAGDLSASQRARVDGNFDPVSEYPGDFWHFARVQVVTAARVAGIDAIDAPYPAYQDPDGYRRSAVHASLLGFDGKWAIHPGQIPIANEVFSPTAEEVADAQRVDRDLPGRRGRRRRRHRPRRPARRRRPHAPGREHPLQGLAGRGRAGGRAGERRGGP